MKLTELLAYITGLKDSLQKYIETKSAYYALLAFEKAAKLLSLLMANTAWMMAGLLALIFLSGALAIYLGEVLQSAWLGMLIVGGFYLLLVLLFYAWRKRIFGRMAIRILQDVFFDMQEILLDEKKKKKG